MSETAALTQRTIAIIDDSAFNRRTLAGILQEEFPDHRIVTARDGEEGLKILEKEDPAVVTLDLEMPRMDGFTFLRVAMAQKPRPVIVVSAKKDERSLLKALELGALDYISKPTQQASQRLNEIREEYVEKVRMAMSMDSSAVERRSKILARRAQARPQRVVKLESSNSEVTRLVLIGASTGGPAAVQTVLSQIEPHKHLAIAVAQHMPEGFTAAFASRLNAALPFDVKEVTSVEPMRGNAVYVARGGRNLVVTNQNDRLFLASMRPSSKCRFVPSIDQLFCSAAEQFPRRMMAVVLTGMGNDGLEGAHALTKRKLPIIVESEKTAVVYGMPKVVEGAGLATAVADLDRIAEEINRWLVASF